LAWLQRKSFRKKISFGGLREREREREREVPFDVWGFAEEFQISSLDSTSKKMMMIFKSRSELALLALSFRVEIS
jgi:hypothetical protein